jgi:hypothetical protein
MSQILEFILRLRFLSLKVNETEVQRQGFFALKNHAPIHVDEIDTIWNVCLVLGLCRYLIKLEM